MTSRSAVLTTDPAAWARQLPAAGTSIDGRLVRGHVPNLDSIEATLSNAEVLPGIRAVPLSAFDYEPGPASARILALAAAIRVSRELNPLIIGVDSKGIYAIEGGDRLDALFELRAAALPALVVLDLDDLALTASSGPGAKVVSAKAAQEFLSDATKARWKAAP